MALALCACGPVPARHPAPLAPGLAGLDWPVAPRYGILLTYVNGELIPISASTASASSVGVERKRVARPGGGMQEMSVEHPASWAVDGNDATQWSSRSGDPDPWWAIALPYEAVIRTVVVKMRPITGKSDYYTIEASDDGINYRPNTASTPMAEPEPNARAIAYRNTTWNNEAKDTSLVGKFLRIHFHRPASHAKRYFSIFEISVYGEKSQAAQQQTLGITSLEQIPDPIQNTGTLIVHTTGQVVNYNWTSSMYGNFDGTFADQPRSGRSIQTTTSVVTYTRPNPVTFGRITEDSIDVGVRDVQGQGVDKIFTVRLSGM